jgi:hypothetical protein
MTAAGMRDHGHLHGASLPAGPAIPNAAMPAPLSPLIIVIR